MATRAKSVRLNLFDNIQFIYELNLAEMELDAFGSRYRVSPDMRTFTLTGAPPELGETLRGRTAYFTSVNGEPSDYSVLCARNRTRSVNQYLTHWIYPYKGKFHPQMIRALLNIIGMKPGDTLFEPFCGSGTAVLEAQLLGAWLYDS